MTVTRAHRIAGLAVVLTTALTGTGVAVAQADIKWQSVSSGRSLTGSCDTSRTTRLSSGSSGQAVKNAQCLLNRHGNYRLSLNGKFDARTKAAVNDFKTKNGLAKDGVVGSGTWRALQKPALGTISQPKKPKVSAERMKTLARAKVWMTARHGDPIPYSQADYYKGYRTDCSGYASMALNLGGSPNTVGLAQRKYTRKIAMLHLQPGDLVLNWTGPYPSQHVVIFEKWNNKAKTSYTAYEQTGDGMRTRHRTLRYGLEKNSFYEGRRPTKYED